MRPYNRRGIVNQEPHWLRGDESDDSEGYHSSADWSTATPGDEEIGIVSEEPESETPGDEDSIEMWLADMDPDYAAEERANALAAMGVNTLYDTLSTRQQLFDEARYTPIQAARIKEAADNLRGSLGLAPVPEPVEAQNIQCHAVQGPPQGGAGARR